MSAFMNNHGMVLLHKFKITSASSLSSYEKKCLVSVESALDLDCKNVNSNIFCDPKTCGVLWEYVLVLQGPISYYE